MPGGVPFGDVLLFGLQIDWIQRVRGPVYLRRWCRCHAFQSTTSVERDFLTRLFDALKMSPVFVDFVKLKIIAVLWIYSDFALEIARQKSWTLWKDSA